QDIVLSPLASGKAVVSAEEQELGCCLLDIGGGTTDLIVFHGGAVKRTAVLSVGGTHSTNDIAAGLRSPAAAAEAIKRKHGAARLDPATKDETLEVPSTGGRAPRVLSNSVLCDIIEPRVSEIITLAHRELIKAGCDEYLTSGVVLTGGTANLHGVSEVAEQVL